MRLSPRLALVLLLPALALTSCASHGGSQSFTADGGGDDSTAPGADGGGDSTSPVDGGGGDACAHTLCSGACVDTASDPKNCGKCGHACLGHDVCTSGKCTSTCTATQTDCSGNCVDTTSDPGNCGACAHACGTGKVCSAGGCQTPGTVVFSVPMVASNGAPALDAQGNVYTVGIDGKVRELDPHGTVSWTSITSVGAGHSSYYAWGGIALGTNQLYVGGPDGDLYAFDMTGTFKWKVPVGGDLTFATPAVGGTNLGGAIVAGGGNNTTAVVAVDPSGTVKWTYTLGGTTYASSPAIAHDGTTYVATWSDQNVYAIDTTGHLKWKSSNGGGAVTSAAIGHDGTIYVGNHAPSDGIFRAFKPDGTAKWTYTVGNFHGGSALDGEDTVYIGNDTMLVSLTLLGMLKWQVSAGTLPIVNSGEHWVCGSNAVGDDGNVYVPVCGSYSLSVFEPLQGKLLYEVQLDGFPSPITIGHEGLLYVGTTAGTFYAIAVSAHAPAPTSSWPKHHRDRANTGEE
jgi:hypothetical protein